jgi:hypothetical protein
MTPGLAAVSPDAYQLGRLVQNAPISCQYPSLVSLEHVQVMQFSMMPSIAVLCGAFAARNADASGVRMASADSFFGAPCDLGITKTAAKGACGNRGAESSLKFT